MFSKWRKTKKKNRVGKRKCKQDGGDMTIGETNHFPLELDFPLSLCVCVSVCVSAEGERGRCVSAWRAKKPAHFV